MNYPLLYVEHLSQQDLRMLAQSAGLSPAEIRSRINARPESIEHLLKAPDLFDLVFAGDRDGLDPGVSTFLAFGILVHRSAHDLSTTSHVPEWSGPGKRLPVFDVEPLRAFLDDGPCRFFLIEVLDSFTKVASGSYLVRTRTGVKRRRFSELDLGRMTEVVELLPASERPGGYRRLGDIALFMSGVFPDHAATHPLPATHRRLVVESAAITAADALTDDGGLRFLDTAGAGWYRRAAEEVEHVNRSGSGFLRKLSDRFGEARRILNYMADRYLLSQQFG